ncbi:MAG: hypothetical protein K6L75_13975 [Cellvibrionaceae bacterium]
MALKSRPLSARGPAALGVMTDGAMKNKGWIKIFSETYDDCIVGDADGLISLKESIDQALLNESSDISNHCKADFTKIVLTKEKWHETEAVEVPKWQGYIFQFMLAVWVVLLPIMGLVFLYQQVRS